MPASSPQTLGRDPRRGKRRLGRNRRCSTRRTPPSANDGDPHDALTSPAEPRREAPHIDVGLTSEQAESRWPSQPGGAHGEPEDGPKPPSARDHAPQAEMGPAVTSSTIFALVPSDGAVRNIEELGIAALATKADSMALEPCDGDPCSCRISISQTGSKAVLVIMLPPCAKVAATRPPVSPTAFVHLLNWT